MSNKKDVYIQVPVAKAETVKAQSQLNPPAIYQPFGTEVRGSEDEPFEPAPLPLTELLPTDAEDE